MQDGAWAGCWAISRGYPTLTVEHMQALTGIVLEAALRFVVSSMTALAFLLGQGHILTEANHRAHQCGAFVR